MSRVFSTSQFQGFLEGERARIATAYREVEELQCLYQGRYVAEKAHHDGALSALADRLGQAAPEDLGTTLCAQAEARREVEQAAIAERAAELEKKIPELQNEADGLLIKVQQEVARMRDLNPKLNQQEERTKADIAAGQQELDDLNKRISARAARLGFITHGAEIHQLDRDRYKVVGRLDALQKSLEMVRRWWKEAADAASQSETGLLSEWRDAVAQLGDLRQEQQYVAQNARSLAWRRTLIFVFENLGEVPPDAPPDLSAALAQIVDLNRRTGAFQEALGSVAGVLGLAKGMDQGLQRFVDSVKTLKREETQQSEYLSPLRIELTEEALHFGAVWDALAAAGSDEKTLAEHPADFVAKATPYVERCLSQAQIAGFFDALGKALKLATAAWS
jgi:hypothetical protein